jgi:TIR domain-containing protein/effector-associated domain 7 (EAD7)-containing protein
MGEDLIDFFISYTKSDQAWAEWIAWELKQSGYQLLIQAWHIQPGTNFPLEMHQATAQARHTLLVLSPRSLAAPYVMQEVAAALVRDPSGKARTLIPVRVEECEPPGLLKAIVYIDLVGLDQQAASRALLRGVTGDLEPRTPVPFPRAAAPPPFPATRPPAGATADSPRHDTIDKSTGPALSELRRALRAAFDDSQFDAFCLDIFPEVYERFTGGMDRDRKTTLLLDHCRRRRQLALLDRQLHDLTS